MNLIANTGIQFFTKKIEIDLNDNFKMYFHESLDIEDQLLKMELVHHFSDYDLWVRKRDLAFLGYLNVQDRQENGRIIKKGTVNASWDEIKDDFISSGYTTIPIETATPEESGCFRVNLNKCRLERFENRWMPLPFFTLGNNNNSEFGPTNWCRFKLIPVSTTKSIKTYNLLLAFDTRAKYEDEDFEDQDLMETPVFESAYDKYKQFALCNNEFSLLNFCSKANNCEWVDEYILKLYHGVNKIDELNVRKPKLNYLAQYIFILQYIQQLDILPNISLFSDKNAAFGNVDLVVDIGNSRTCAVLFDDSDFTKVEPLALQNFTSPIRNNQLNSCNDPFDMRLAFREADFGGNMIEGSSQFVYPSMVRLGVEAESLIYKATHQNTGIEKTTTFSSPKRYLWDSKPQEKEWGFVTLEDEKSKSIWIKGVSEQLNSDGSINTLGEGGVIMYYSRKALMTFSFLEILAQAKAQINSYKFRHKWGNESTPRRIGRIIITCPTAMSRVEQVALRECAQDAAIIIDRFYEGTYYEECDKSSASSHIKVIPSIKGLTNIEERDEWIYDEATCSQFLYLYAEINERYLKNSKEYFNFYGKVRNDLDDYNKKSITVGSVDIGAGTTDIMIASYKYEDGEQCTLTPVPLYWESFYIAGDDLLKELIRQLVIEGKYAAIQQQLEMLKKSDIPKLLLDFFGKDNARLDVTDRQIRSEFNLQVSVPVILYFLDLLNKDKVEKSTLSFDDIFTANKPTERVLDKFTKHFGFSVQSVDWEYDKEVISKIVERTFDTLIGKISTVLSYYGCDIVLLAGRPTSLKPLSNLFLKYYAVSPNRLITLDKYRIGTWYPFQDGKGYFKDAKSVVAVGAMIGNRAATSSLNGFSLNLSELNKAMLPTTEYFSISEYGEPFITPEQNFSTIEVFQLPTRVWCRQLNSASYPTRPFYKIDFNRDEIEKRMIIKYNLNEDNKGAIKDAFDGEIERLQSLRPFRISIVRENYVEDKETLMIDSVQNRNYDELPTAYFAVQTQSMMEDDNYWLDSGEFHNLSINHI